MRILTVMTLMSVALSSIGPQSAVSDLGDGGPATAAQLAYPHGVAIDTAGNIYIADTTNHRVRKVTRDGVSRTVAGNGSAGVGGEGGPAVQAGLSNPENVAVDSAGNIYIADGSNRVYKVTLDGILHLFAGTGRHAFTGDA